VLGFGSVEIGEHVELGREGDGSALSVSYVFHCQSSPIFFERVTNNPSINIFPDDVLLEIFDFVRLNGVHVSNHEGWYKLAHTCRTWTQIIFSSPSRLDLQLNCTYGSPVSEILRYSPPLPLIVDYGERRPLPADDKKGVLLALQKHDHVRSIGLHASAPTLDKLLEVINGTFSVLEYLVLSTGYPDADEDDEDETESEDDGPIHPILPLTFRAPHLRCLNLKRVGSLVEPGLPLLACLSGLTSLALIGIPYSLYLPLEYLASRLSLMPHLEYLGLSFGHHISANDSLREQVDGPLTKQISFPNLSKIYFQGGSSYLEDLTARVIGNAPLLSSFDVTFLEEPSSTLSHVYRLLSAATELRLPVASIKFSGTRVDTPHVDICMARSEQTLDRWSRFAPFQLFFLCNLPNIQVASAGEICTALTSTLSAVQRLHLDLDGGRRQFGPEVDIEDARWHTILESSTSLQLRLYCIYGKPIVDRLKFSPPHPLDIMFAEERPMSTKDKEGVLLESRSSSIIAYVSLIYANLNPSCRNYFRSWTNPFRC